MSFDKAIEHNKEHRKPYRGSKAIDKTCRCHGSCMYCLSNRMYRTNKDKLKLKLKLLQMNKIKEGEFYDRI